MKLPKSFLKGDKAKPERDPVEGDEKESSGGVSVTHTMAAGEGIDPWKARGDGLQPYVVLNLDPSKAKPGKLPGEFSFDAVDPKSVFKRVEVITDAKGTKIREDQLARFALAHQGNPPPEVKDLPPMYQKWFHLKKAEGLKAFAKEAR